MLLLLWLWLNMLLLSCGERPSQHRHGRLGSLQFGSRERSEGSGGGVATGAIRVAADERAFLGLGLTVLEMVEPCFCDPNLDWVTGARGCTPTLVLVGADGTFEARRGEEVVIVFMFLSSL